MKNLYSKVGEMEFDGLITDVTPEPIVRGGTIRKLAADATIARGTILAKSSTDNKLVVLGTAAAGGETLTPDCILCDDIDVGTASDEPAEVYYAGCFDPNKCTVASGYTLTEADKDALRVRGILFKAAVAAN